MYYNIRDNTGKFTRVPPSRPIRVGALYGWRGSIVRAGTLATNGFRHVSVHKQLHGFVKDSELQLIPKDKVHTYLQTA